MLDEGPDPDPNVDPDHNLSLACNCPYVLPLTWDTGSVSMSTAGPDSPAACCDRTVLMASAVMS